MSAARFHLLASSSLIKKRKGKCGIRHRNNERTMLSDADRRLCSLIKHEDGSCFESDGFWSNARTTRSRRERTTRQQWTHRIDYHNQEVTGDEIMEQVNYEKSSPTTRTTTATDQCYDCSRPTIRGEPLGKTSFNYHHHHHHHHINNNTLKKSASQRHPTLALKANSSIKMLAIILISIILSTLVGHGQQVAPIHHQRPVTSINSTRTQPQTSRTINNDVIKTTTTTTTAATTAFNGLTTRQQQQQQQQQHQQQRQHQLADVAANQRNLRGDPNNDDDRTPFKYHLNHLNPPSLVPITIQQQQQQQPKQQQQQVAPLRRQQQPQPHDNRQAASVRGTNSLLQMRKLMLDGGQGGADEDSMQLQAADTQLVQLQLPLQLHLKLKPLPLPMPPPPERPPTGLIDGQQRPVNSRPRRRSLDSLGSQERPQTATTTTTQQPDGASAAPMARQQVGGWQEEAKRALVWSSMAPALVQQAARLERRTMSMSMGGLADFGGSPTPAFLAGHLHNHLEDQMTPSSASPVQVSQEQQRQHQQLVGLDLATTTTTTEMPIKSEVRRQRHSAQQALDYAAANDNNNLQQHSSFETRIQAMAAAMLPFVWPSFQLTSGQAPASQKLRARSLDRSTLAPNSWPSMEPLAGGALTPIGGSSSSNKTGPQRSPMAASEFRPTIVSIDTPLTTTTSTTSRPSQVEATHAAPIKVTKERTRKKRRKPGYLQRQAAMLNQQRHSSDGHHHKSTGGGRGAPQETNTSSSPEETSANAPYPDSTRMASRYPMPRIKFNPIGSSPTGITNQTVAASKVSSKMEQPTAVATQQRLPEGRIMQPLAQVPKSLSKLIEQQMQLSSSNATALINSINGTSSSMAAVELMMKSGQLAKFLAPTTSVSRVVRLQAPANKIGSQGRPEATFKLISLPLQSGPSASKSHFPLDFERINSTSKPAKPVPTTTTTTTPTTSTTTTTTGRPSTPAEGTSRPVAPRTTTTTSITIQVPLVSSTESTALRQSLEAPTSSPERPRVHSNSSSTSTSQPMMMADREESTTTTTTTTTTTLPTTTTGKAKKFGQHSKADAGKELQQQRHQLIRQRQASLTNNNNIKLFHFKRKPDMNKLPFYKKPLNYSDFTGWTSEQIQEHLLELADQQQQQDEAANNNKQDEQQDDNNNNNNNDAAADDEDDDGEDRVESGGDESSGKRQQTTATTKQKRKMKRTRNGGSSSSSQLIESAQVQQPGLIETTSGQQQQQQLQMQSLLKRKRRAKNQFERLMAELQAAAAASSPAGSPEAPPVERASPGVELQAVGLVESASSGDQVPVMRKKLEPLVMKPMFFVMNQKRRQQTPAQNKSTTSTAPTEPPVVLTTLSLPVVSSNRSSAIETTNSSETLKLLSDSLEHLKSKPIVRMRRKHHGDQPLQLFGAGHQPTMADLQPWRPSRPIWSAPLSQQHHQRLMLVPSGLLTPSGSHLMPYYAADHTELVSPAGRKPVVVDTWRPTQLTRSLRPDEAQAPRDSFLVAPSAPAVSNSVSNVQQQPPISPVGPPAGDLPLALSPPPPPQQPTSVQSTPPGELRVPKLLVKPMRPAKYSLNGYIPKPSLNNPASQLQQQHHHQSQPARPTPQGGNQQQSKLAQTLAKKAPNSSMATRPMLFGGGSPQTNSKDLDSSTSNEIFSRRRGLQQHQRSIQSKAQLSFDSLVVAQQPSSPEAATSSLANLMGNYSQTTANDNININISNNNNKLKLNQMQKRQLMEENRRKYVQLHQAASARSPTLSLQKANQIKAKLGLQASSSASGRRGDAEWKSASNNDGNDDNDRHNQAQQASTSSISTLDFPGAARTSTTTDNMGKQQEQMNDLASQSNGKQLIGAPLNSIPKTDFECTDKKGRFVSGLFADHKTGCQVWHLCSNNRKYSFLCPTGTIFNAKVRICDWRYNVKCENSLPF